MYRLFGGFKKQSFSPWSHWILRKLSNKNLSWSCRPFSSAQLFGSWPYFDFIILIWNVVNWLVFITWNSPVSWREYHNQRDIPLAYVRTSSHCPENILQETVYMWMIPKWIISHRQLAIKLCLKKINSICFQKQIKTLSLWHFRD